MKRQSHFNFFRHVEEDAVLHHRFGERGELAFRSGNRFAHKLLYQSRMLSGGGEEIGEDDTFALERGSGAT